MMKKTFAFAVSILIACGHVASQISFENTILQKYYLFVNKAEMAIVSKDHLKAVSYYKQAFAEQEGGGFYKDHHNALRTSDVIGNEEFAWFNAFILAGRGICPEYFDQFEILKNSSEEKYAELQTFAAREAENVSRVEYREKIEKIYQLDQQARWDRLGADSIARTDSLNFIRFAELVKSYGFPSEDRIGLICTENEAVVSVKELRVLLRHFAQRKNQDLVTILTPAFSKLEIDSYQYATVLELLDQKTYNYNVQPVINIGESFYIENFNDSMRTLINKRRAALYLSTREDKIEKTKAYLKGELKGYSMDISYMGLDKDFLPQSYIDKALTKINIEKN